MLQQIRDGVKGWLAYAIVFLIAIPFVFVGGYSYFAGGDGRVVAEVDGEEIPRERVEQVFQQQRQRLREAFGDELPEGFDDARLRRSALEEVVDQTLMQNYVRRQGFRVSDQEVARHIRSQQIFQVGGRFSRERYENLLRQNRLAPEQYEDLVRQDLLVDQFQQAVLGSAAVSDRELANFVALRDQTRDFRYVQYDAAGYLDGIEVSDADIQAFYQEHTDRFMEPEAVRLEYLEITPEAVGEEAAPSEDDLRAYYDETRSEREEGGRREARHILLALDEDADAERREAALEQAEALRDRLRDGESFDDLAAEYSDDPGTADVGGQLGWVERGEMVDAFEDAMFSLPEGEISEPVVTRFGVHLIRVDDVEAGDAPSFEDIRDELQAEWLQDHAGTDLLELGDEMANVAFEQPDSLEPAAEVAGLEIRRTDWIPREGTDDGLGSYAAVLDAAFDPEVLDNRYNSDLIELSSTRFVLIRLLEHREAAPKDLAEVSGEIRDRLRDRQARERAADDARGFVDALADGADWDELASERGLKTEVVEAARRTEGNHPGDIVSRAFRMAADRPGVVTYETGAAAVRVDGIESGRIEALDPQERIQVRQQLLSATARQELTSVLHTLRQSADIRYRRDDLREPPEPGQAGGGAVPDSG